MGMAQTTPGTASAATATATADLMASSALVPAPAQALVQRIRSEINLEDRANITRFGEPAQRAVTEFADRILAQTRNKEMGKTGDLLTEVLAKARGLDPAKLKNVGLFERLFSSMENRLFKFRSRFEDVATQIEKLAIEIDRHKETLRRDVAVMDQLHDQTKLSIEQLDAHIEAGKAFAEEYKRTVIPELKAKADAALTSGEAPMEAQEYNDAMQALDRFEKRVFYLQQARMIGIQQLPQIRTIQAADETLVENLQATTTLTLPAWKQKMIVLLGLHNQAAALELQRTVTDATSKMIRETSEMMKGQSVEIERQSQKGIVDMQALEDANKNLISTITSVVQIQQEGRQKRAEAEKRMEQMTEDLRRALAEQRV
jgi:uncharacterized protein YaaN involved in tellurite resistance